MKKMDLKTKLVLTYLLVGLAPLLTVGIYSWQKSSSALSEAAVEKLIAVRDVKGEAVKRYFEGIRDQIITFSDNIMVRDAMESFSKEFKTFSSENNWGNSEHASYKSHLKGFYQNQFSRKYEKENGKKLDSLSLISQLSNTEVALQYHYISKNTYPLGEKEKLNFSLDTSSYSKSHRKFHPSFRTYLKKFGYYDIFLVDIDSGNIVYSVYKELDFATSLLTGPYRNTNFAKAFARAKKLTSPDSFVIVDYKKYLPSYEAPASFIANAIWKNGKKIGVAIFQMPIDRLSSIMSERAGMGKTGETYLFGEDKLMRSDSFLDFERHGVLASFKHSESGSLSSIPVSRALEGKTGSSTEQNYLDQKVISAYKPIDILGLKWGLIAEINTSEALFTVDLLKNTIIKIVIGSLISIILLAFFMSKKLAKDLASKILLVAEKLVKCSQNVGHSSTSILESSTFLSETATEQAASLQETVSSIDEISSMVQKNADAADGSTKVSKESNEMALEGKRKVESMISSIKEISTGNEEIAKEMEKSNQNIEKIIKVISDIGEKTKVINDIVFQTKLLSFNASVEAARAGEHGKGFAVVAEEVGNLASMSGKAALEITEMLDSSIKQVTDIVESTKKNVDILIQKSKKNVSSGTETAYSCGEALDEIIGNVGSVNELVREIASASSEQSTGVQEVTKAMQQLDETTHRNTSLAQESSEMAKNLKSHADQLTLAIDELKGIIGGDEAEKKSKKNSSSVEGAGKVIEITGLASRKVEVSEPRATRQVKVSGLDVSIPDQDDSRFEDI